MQTQRPQVRYRQELLQRLAALKPQRVLEVGCGGGGFLRGGTALGIDIAGIDPDEASLKPLQDEGFDVRVGQAERLPFGAASFDAVVLCFTAHHIGDWHAALLEALRVGGGTVLVLDPWYDTGIASQAVAERFDRWCKLTDRARGMIHHDCLDTAQLLAPIATRLREFQIRVDRLLDLQELGLDRLDEITQAQLRGLTPEPAWMAELDSIRRQARQAGISDDGAILLSIARNDHSA